MAVLRCIFTPLSFRPLYQLGLALAIFLYGGYGANSQKLAPFTVSENGGVIRLDGPLDALSSRTFARALRGAPNARIVELNSGGGNLLIALEIAERIFESSLVTRVRGGETCESACALLFLAGRQRRLDGRLGVHQFASPSDDIAATQTLMAEVMHFLERAEVAPELTGRLLRTPNDAMYYFSGEEVARLNLAPLSARNSAPVLARCDALASDPMDSRKPADLVGVDIAGIDAFSAVEACSEAVEADPTNPRMAYQYGRALMRSKRHEEAAAMFRRAAEADYPIAQAALGVAYDRGSGVSKDASEAFKWTRRAAEQNEPLAQAGLAFMYGAGKGVEADPKAAAAWIEKAAEQGLPFAEHTFGQFYARGIGVAKNDETAVEWFRRAAEQGLPDAAFELGLAYETGVGVSPDQRQAVQWFERAAAGGHEEAKAKLGQ